MSCGKADARTANGGARCAECNAKAHKDQKPRNRTRQQLDEENTNKREWAHMRKAAHLCIECGTKDSRTINGKCQCLQCAKKRADQRREAWDYDHQKELRDARTARWKAAGLCSNCGGPREDETKAMCAVCRLKYRLRNARKKIEQGKLPRGANGRCFQCNRAPAIEGKKLCRECYAKKVETILQNGKHRGKGAKA